MKKINPEILCHPNIPKPLHGVAPRVIAGAEWWDQNRRKAYAEAGYCCEACGVPKEEAKYHQWLEAHEYYVYDYQAGTVTFDHLVALCHSCHNFIHNGRMAMMVEQGKMEEEKYNDIMEHGLKIIKDNGLTAKYSTRHSQTFRKAWGDIKMVFEGKEYGPSSDNMQQWLAGKWRNWSPTK